MEKKFLILRVAERTGFGNPFPYRILHLDEVIKTSTAFLALKKYQTLHKLWCSQDFGYTIGRVGRCCYSIFDEFERTVLIAVEEGFYYYDDNMKKVILTEDGLKNEFERKT